MDPQIENRTFPLEIRAASEGEKPHIDGTAAVYNRWSEDLGGFTEKIEPGFFENTLKSDVRALWNHNADLVLGRTKSSTLTLEDTERGMDVHIDPPDTQIGRDAVTSIRRGDVDQMSFAFSVKADGDEWNRDQKTGAITRVLKRGGCEKLYDVSPVTYPAYPQTNVHVRSKIEELSTASLEQEPPADGEEEQKQAQARVKNALRKLQLQLKQRA